MLRPLSRDDHYYQIQSERSQIFTEKENLEKSYQTLLEEHKRMQAQQEDIISERDEALSQVRNMRHEVDGRRSEKADVHLRAELDRVRAEL